MLDAPHPHRAKALGREVRGFDQAAWSQPASTSSSPEASPNSRNTKTSEHTYPGTGDRVLVEASPVDRVWGIGMAATTRVPWIRPSGAA